MLPWSPTNLTEGFLFVIGGFLLLGFGAGKLVDGGATLASRLGVSPLVVGLTVVAWGTSVPEVVVSTLAALEGRPASSLGNVLGSNVANIGLVLGCAGLILQQVLLVKVSPRDLTWSLVSVAILWLLFLDGRLARLEAAGLLVAFLIYTTLLVKTSSGSESESSEHSASSPVLMVLLGTSCIALGAELVMSGGTFVAESFGMADTVLGLTILALGTSLPELFAGVVSCLKGHAEIGIGNVVGSNLFNTLMVTGITGMIHPLDLEGREAALAFERDFPVAMGFGVVLVFLPFLARHTPKRFGGALLLAGYLFYMLNVVQA